MLGVVRKRGEEGKRTLKMLDWKAGTSKNLGAIGIGELARPLKERFGTSAIGSSSAAAAVGNAPKRPEEAVLLLSVRLDILFFGTWSWLREKIKQILEKKRENLQFTILLSTSY